MDLCINKNPMLASDSAHAMRDHTARQTMPDTQIQAASATQISYDVRVKVESSGCDSGGTGVGEAVPKQHRARIS